MALQTSSVFRLPPAILIRCLADLVRKPQSGGESFQRLHTEPLRQNPL